MNLFKYIMLRKYQQKKDPDSTFAVLRPTMQFVIKRRYCNKNKPNLFMINAQRITLFSNC